MVKINQNRFAITIGDVCGKGVPASLFMAITQTVMRLVVRAGENLQAEVGAANDLIVANNREEMFTTLFCGVIDAPSGTVTYCNCGHNPPLVLRRGQGTFEPLRACGRRCRLGFLVLHQPAKRLSNRATARQHRRS